MSCFLGWWLSMEKKNLWKKFQKGKTARKKDRIWKLQSRNQSQRDKKKNGEKRQIKRVLRHGDEKQWGNPSGDSISSSRIQMNTGNEHRTQGQAFFFLTNYNCLSELHKPHLSMLSVITYTLGYFSFWQWTSVCAIYSTGTFPYALVVAIGKESNTAVMGN